MDQLINIEVSIPKEAMGKLVKTANETFEKLIYPLTSATLGLGGLIENYFHRLNDVQKIYATECVRRAKEKVENTKDNNQENPIPIKPIIFYRVFDHLENQVDENQIELMSNILVNEITTGSVHPEIVRLITMLTTDDIILLLNISENQEKIYINRLFQSIKNKNKASLAPDQNSFNHFYLKDLGLIIHEDGNWKNTYSGLEVLLSINPLE